MRFDFGRGNRCDVGAWQITQDNANTANCRRNAVVLGSSTHRLGRWDSDREKDDLELDNQSECAAVLTEKTHSVLAHSGVAFCVHTRSLDEQIHVQLIVL